MLSTVLFDTIQDIDPCQWDGILDEKDFFHRYDFIRVVQESKVENALFFYLLFYDKDKLVATTVFSAFHVNLDLFISKGSFVRGLKKIFPRLFRVRILACGLPASFGQLNLVMTDDKYAGEICEVIAKQMKKLAKKLHISLLTVKEFRTAEKTRFKHLEDHGFFIANSVPYMILDLKWDSFEEYLAALRHPYRRKIRLSLEKIKGYKPFVLRRPAKKDAALFHKMYLGVMERTDVKLETLNEEFFTRLFESNNDLKLLDLVINDEIICSALLSFSGSELIFILAGRAEGKDKYDSYFNMVYEIIALGIRSGMKRIRMGQTSYWVKQCVGAVEEPEYIYFASRRSIVHRILRSLRNSIFPAMNIKPLNVFHKSYPVAKPGSVPQQYEYSE